MTYDEAVKHLTAGGVIRVKNHPERLRKFSDGVIHILEMDDSWGDTWVSTGRGLEWLQELFPDYYEAVPSEADSKQNFVPAYLEALDELKVEAPANQLFTAEEAVKLTAKAKEEKIEKELASILADIKSGIESELITSFSYTALNRAIADKLAEKLANLQYSVSHKGTYLFITWGGAKE